jgi:hypothetical protein
MLMCARHWRLVPRDTQRLVWKAYRPGQERDKRPTAGYLIVQAIAVGQVAVKEGLWTEDQYVEHVLARSKRFFDRMTDADFALIQAWMP